MGRPERSAATGAGLAAAAASAALVPLVLDQDGPRALAALTLVVLALAAVDALDRALGLSALVRHEALRGDDPGSLDEAAFAVRLAGRAVAVVAVVLVAAAVPLGLWLDDPVAPGFVVPAAAGAAALLLLARPSVARVANRFSGEPLSPALAGVEVVRLSVALSAAALGQPVVGVVAGYALSGLALHVVARRFFVRGVPGAKVAVHRARAWSVGVDDTRRFVAALRSHADRGWLCAARVPLLGLTAAVALGLERLAPLAIGLWAVWIVLAAVAALLPGVARPLAGPPAAVAVAAPAPVPVPALADPVLGPPTPDTTRVGAVDAVALGGVLAVAMALLAPWLVPRWLPGEPADVAGVVAALSVVLFADVAAAPFRAALRDRGGLTGPRSHRQPPRPVTLPALVVGLLPLVVDARSPFAWAVAVAASSVVAAGAVILQASASVPEVRLALRRPLLQALAVSAVVAVGCAQVVVARASAPDALAVVAAVAAAVAVLAWLAERLRPPRPAPRPEAASSPRRTPVHTGRRRHTAARHRRPSAAGHAR